MHQPPRLLPLLATMLLGATFATGCAQAEEPAAGTPSSTRVSADDAVESVLAISVDGLNPDALRRLGRRGAPHLHALQDGSASTLNARTEHEQTFTLPNHTGMVTGRRIDPAAGGHGVIWNDDRRTPKTVQRAAGRDVASVFTVVNQAGGSSAVFASKTVFTLWKRSWPVSIDRSVIDLDNQALAHSLSRDLVRNERAFRMLHLSLLDDVGHDTAFMSRPYLRAVRQVDELVGSVIATIDADPDLSTSLAVILTSDHGGLGVTHSDPTSLANYRVPFMVRGPGVTPGTDLYELNPDYKNPGDRRTTYEQRRQPVRNGDLANLALDLLDLPAVPGSEHNADLDLNVR